LRVKCPLQPPVVCSRFFKYYIPDSNGESREGVDCGDDLRAEDTAKEVAEIVPLVVPLLPSFLGGLMREEFINLSPLDGAGCCFAS
jgi:hypothetical protein